MRLSAPPVDCATVEEEEEEPVWLAALEDAAVLEDPLEVDSAAAEEVLDAESLDAEDVAEASEAEEELPLAAAVELAPAAHVADWGRLLTPWPPQRELANLIVAAKDVLLVTVV